MAHQEGAEDGAQSGRKRSSAESPGNAQKSKRPRYVSNACNECKRRKVKCDGVDPCQRCVNSMMLCSYHRPSRNNDGTSAPSPTTHAAPGLGGGGGALNVRDREVQQLTMQLRTVMEKVDSLNQRLSAISPPSPSQQPGPSIPAAEESVALGFQPENVPQPGSLGARDSSMQPSVTIEPETISPEYHGPTSSEFTFEVANESLIELGVGCSISNSNQSSKSLSFPAIFRNQTADTTLLRNFLARDPLWVVTRSDALRYIDTYHNTVGAMYPATDGSCLAPKVQLLFDALDVARGRRYQGGFGSLIELMFSVDTKIIKILLAIGMVSDLGVAGTDAAVKLVQSVLDSSDDSLMNAEGLSGVQILVSIALFYYHLDDELKGSRYSCLASRRCLEMGLHRRDALVKHFPDEGARKQALRIFWSVFTLDRRSSLGLGVPFVIQDTLVDPTLGALDFDHPYLRSMIPFAKLSGKAWQMSNDFSNSKERADADVDLVREQIDYLDYQVLQWQKQIPAPIRYCHGVTEIASCGYDSRGDYHHDIGRHGGNGRSDTDSDSAAATTAAATTSRRQFYLAVVLFVRSNQLRNLIYRPLLQSAARIRTHPEHTLTALTIARDSLQAFADLDSRTDLLHTHATFFKHFIVSSLGNLLLIVVHAAAAAATTEAETDSATDTDIDLWAPIRETFHVAAALLRKLSARSGPMLRAWDRLKCLEDLQAKILAARRVKAGSSINAHVHVQVQVQGQGHHQHHHHHQRDLDLDHLEMDPYTAVSGIRPPLPPRAAEGWSLMGLASDNTNTNSNGNGNGNDNAGLPPASLLSSSSLRTEDYMLFDSQIRDEFAGLFDPTFGFGDAYEFPLP